MKVANAGPNAHAPQGDRIWERHGWRMQDQPAMAPWLPTICAISWLNGESSSQNLLCVWFWRSSERMPLMASCQGVARGGAITAAARQTRYTCLNHAQAI